MLRVPIAYAKPGMVLAMPILHPRRPDTVLLQAGIELDAHAILRLAEINLRDVWIRYPATEFLCEYYCPEVFHAQAALTQRVADAFDMVIRGAHAKLEFNEYRHAVSGLIDRLLLFPKSAVWVQELADRDQPLLRHSSAVSILSVLLGLKLEDYLIVERSRLSTSGARDVAGLGLGAMLHDAGMLRLPAEVVQRWNQTQDETDPDWRAHVHIGYEMCKDALGPAAAAAVLHHHQKFDGSGFPRRLKLDGTEERVRGSDIHVYARIVTMADLFDRLRFPPGLAPTSAPVPTVRVLKRLQEEPYASWYDPMAFKALLAVVPAYAPGTFVRLNNGRRALVTEWFPHDPCRPNLQILADGETPADMLANPDAPIERVVMNQRLELAIIEAEGQDVSKDNFYPTSPGQYDLKLAGRQLFNGAAKSATQTPVKPARPADPGTRVA